MWHGMVLSHERSVCFNFVLIQFGSLYVGVKAYLLARGMVRLIFFIFAILTSLKLEMMPLMTWWFTFVF